MAPTPRPAPVLVLLLLLVPGSALDLVLVFLLLLVPGSAPRPAPLLLLPPAAAPRPAPVCSLLVLLPPVLVLQLLHVVEEPIFAIIGLVHSNISRILRDHLFEVAPVGMMINALGLFQKFLETFLGRLPFLVFLFLVFLLKLRYIVVEVSLTISALFNCLEPLILGLFPRKLRPTALGRHAHLFAELDEVVLTLLRLCLFLLPLLVCALSNVFVKDGLSLFASEQQVSRVKNNL